MKQLWTFAIFAVFLYSCEDLQDNNPALQGIKNGNELWKATFFSSDIDYGGFLIEGRNSFETVQLVTSNDTQGTFNLGGESASVAIFKDANGVVYSTANAPDPSLSLYPTDGQIIVEDVVNSDPKTLIGTFWFHAYTADGLNYFNFSEGVFYNVPLLGGLVVIDNGSICLQATQQVAIAFLAFNAADSTSPEYPDICLAYKNALTAQINACGDSSGNLQALVDSLGDCL
ncbi:MAG: hypothetical protein KJO41_00380 [Bacteroidia bacterium]|nr:hypothetical protein [Bacteroidia bacterium]MBT8277424.1 hypothetical protein [Bacteroidia bacterium]NND24465.1 hypothetical protein [Flavobacteriaceae bacterium]NNK60814.1 hypothetical protein [Flavobacteriaceae bacterium]NNL32864.1 hypothetical protein [Flavobacteriaceae bacterium]